MAPQGSCLTQAEDRKLSEKKTGSDTQALRIQPGEYREAVWDNVSQGSEALADEQIL